MSIKQTRLARQHGQAMVEMVAMGGILGLLFLCIWYLGKFHDIQATTIQAARYSAWERTVHTSADMSDAKLAAQTRARLFTFNRNAYKATDSKSGTQAWGTQNPNWNDHKSFGASSLVKQPQDVTVSTTAGPLPGVAANAVTTVLAGLTKITGALSGGEQLPPGGLHKSTVRVAVSNVASLPAPLNALNINLVERSAIVGDSWDASGPQQAANRVKPFTPAAVMGEVSMILGPMTKVLSILEPAFWDFKPGQICPDIVPNDRVSGKTNLPAYGGAKPCYW